ncbi:MAG: hypothetical protein AAGA56_12510 [Myxococcota bacterium]
MWVRSAAIRPVAPYAILPQRALDRVEDWLGEDEQLTEQRLGELFDRFEHEQPFLAEQVGNALARTRDEVALALGYFLTLAIWLGFTECFEQRLDLVDDLALKSVGEARALDEELRGADPHDAIDTDDVVGMEQPHALSFIQEHLDAALDVQTEEVDIDALDRVYRLILTELLALSYAVRAPNTPGHAAVAHEACA